MQGEESMCSDIYHVLQQQLLRNRVAFIINAKVLTPILIGGYDGRCCHPKSLGLEHLRTSSIKGIWRWWARALAAAALKKKINVYIDLRAADSIISGILGGVQEGSHERGKRASKYTITLGKKLSDADYVSIKDYSNVPRVKLLCRSGGREESLELDRVIKPGVDLEIVVLKNDKTWPAEDEFALWSLVLSLIFDGIGKITSRGFGKLKINSIIGNRVEELNSVLRELYNSETPDALEKSLEELVNKAVEKAEKLVARTNEEIIKHGMKRYDKPLMETPLLEEELMTIKVPNKEFNSLDEALVAIGNASLKMYHKMFLLLKGRKAQSKDEAFSKAQRVSGKDIHTWILGLPRAQKAAIPDNEGKEQNIKDTMKEKIKKLELGLPRYTIEKLVDGCIKRRRNKIMIPTGYYCLRLSDADREKRLELAELRRRSPIRFTLIEVQGSRYFVVVYGFKVFDYEKILDNLLHIGVHYVRRKEGRKTVIKGVKDIDVTPIKNLLLADAKSLEDLLVGMINTVKNLIEESIVTTSRATRKK